MGQGKLGQNPKWDFCAKDGAKQEEELRTARMTDVCGHWAVCVAIVTWYGALC